MPDAALIDSGEPIVLALSRADLRLLAGSVNEAIEAVEDWEFQPAWWVRTRAWPGSC